MGVIIAIIILVLLLNFFLRGTIENVLILNAAENAGPWIATMICVIAIVVVMSYLVVRERFGIKAFLIIVAISGIIQFIILGRVELPDYYRDKNEVSFGLYTAFSAQSVHCLIGYAIARLLKCRIEYLLNDKIYLIKRHLESQKATLKHVNDIIGTDRNMDILSEHLLCLFVHLGNQKLYSDYVDKKLQKEKELVQSVRVIFDNSRINIKTEGCLLSTIEKEVRKRLKEVMEEQEFWKKTKFTSKDASIILAELKKIKSGR